MGAPARPLPGVHGLGRSENCNYCGEPIDHAWVRLTFGGFASRRMNGVSYLAHARCVRPVVPDREVELPERISDPVAEPQLVPVYLSEGEWLAHCRECGDVAQKPELDDAHLAAARHLARVHSGLVGT